jgi:transcriptional regulator with XRE-family HTH domain
MEQIFEGSREELADLKRRVDELVRRFLEQNPQTDLRRIQQLLGLNAGELAHLFGVSRQAVSRWLEQGVPPARQPKLVTILDIAENLTRQLRPERLPAVVRKPAAAFEDLSMLEMIAEDRHDELLRRVRESFDWAATA